MSGHVYESKRLTVTEMIERLEAIEDKTQLVAINCERCEIWAHACAVSDKVRLFHHGADDECPDDERGDLNEYTGCDCAPPMVSISG